MITTRAQVGRKNNAMFGAIDGDNRALRTQCARKALAPLTLELSKNLKNFSTSPSRLILVPQNLTPLSDYERKEKMDNRMGGRATVLIVDDMDDMRQMMKTLFQQRGYQVVIASDGQEALEAALREHPDLILMDLCMPLVDGITATERIHAHMELREVPIVALTAYGIAEVEADALAAGCSACIAKPMNFEKLEGLLDPLIRRGQKSHAQTA